MRSALLIRRDGPFESIAPLLRRLRRRVPGLAIEVVHRDGRRSDSVSPKTWCSNHGIGYRAEASSLPEARSPGRARPALEMTVRGDTNEADLPGLRFVPDPFDDDFDALAASLLSGERSPLTIWMAEDRSVGARAAGTVTVDLAPQDTPRSVGIKSRAACRDLLESVLSGRTGPRDLVVPSDAAGIATVPSARSASFGRRPSPFSMTRVGRTLLARAALSCGVVQLRNWLSRRAGQVPGVVVNFHRVADDGNGHWMTVSTDEFSTYVRFLTENYTVVPLEHLRRRLATGRNVEPLVAITFDDGYHECLTCAAPVLEEFGCTASFFVCSRFLDEDGDFEHDARRGHLGLKKLRGPEARRLHELGFEIGSHSHTHVDFRNASEDAIETELSVSRQRIQSEIGAEVHGLAVPFGSPKHCRPEVFAAARRSGYEYVLSHFDGRNRPGANGFHLLRVRPNLEGLVSLRAAVEGWRGLSGLFSAAPDPRIPGVEEPRA